MYRAYASDPAARINLGIRRRLAPLVGNATPARAALRPPASRCPGRRSSTTATRSGWATTTTSATATRVRTPMQWSPDRNAGFSEANRQRLYLPLILDPEYHFEAVNVAVQEANPSSLLWWMKRVIGLRRRHPALARGTFAVVPTPNRARHRLSSGARRRDAPRGRQPVALRPVVRARPRRAMPAAGSSSCSAAASSRRSPPRPVRASPSGRTRSSGSASRRRRSGRPEVVVAATRSALAAAAGAPGRRAARAPRWPGVRPLARRCTRPTACRTRSPRRRASSTSRSLDLPGRERRARPRAAPTPGPATAISVPFALSRALASGEPADAGVVARGAIAAASVIARARARTATPSGPRRLVDVSSDPRWRAPSGALATPPAPPRERPGRPWRPPPRRARDAPARAATAARRPPRRPRRAGAASRGRRRPRAAGRRQRRSSRCSARWRRTSTAGASPSGSSSRPATPGAATFADEAAGSLDRLLDAALAESERSRPACRSSARPSWPRSAARARPP